MNEKAAHTGPLVTVLLPVYNASSYLRKSIDSILAQTFHDFELLIIDDGSSDESAKIIQSYADPRIRFLVNPKNIGLIATLNRGIAEAKGKYVARMDGDDISLPQRLEKQVQRLEANAGIAVLATFVDFINEDGDVTGNWSTDREAVSEEEIRSLMMRTNCIAHPSVMMRTDVARKFLYNPKQKGAEDWDLWMRMLASGHRIAKLPEVLLEYRVHPSSIMGKDKIAVPLERRLMRVKRKFLAGQLKRFRFNGFFFGVKISWLKNFARHLLSNKFPAWGRDVKRYLTSAPWQVSREGKRFREVLQKYDGRHFFIFPYMHVGGAEKVHAAIVATVADQKPLVIFSNFSDNKKFLERFTASAEVLDVVHYLNYPLTRKKAQQLLSEKMNAAKNAVMFGANSGLFYDLVPQLSPSVKIVDLIHAFKYQPGANLAHRSLLPLAARIDARIFVSSAAKEEFSRFYFHNNIPKRINEKLLLITNAVPSVNEKITEPRRPAGVLFVGRNSEEKRLPLFLEIACKVKAEMPQDFYFTVVGATAEGLNSGCADFKGEITDDRQLAEIYRNHDVLLLTSSREGFPVVIMEAMMHGLVVIATPVGDIPNRLDGENGIVLVSAEKDEVIREMIEHLHVLAASPEEFYRMKSKAQSYAQEHFSETRFRNDYRKLLNV